MYVDRDYRASFSGQGLISFRVVVKDSDLMIMVDSESYSPDLERKAELATRHYRTQLEDYIKQNPTFKSTLEPYILGAGAPPIAIEMTMAGNICGVGPMAAVAGAMAQWVARELKNHVREIIIENGGDLYVDIKGARAVGIFAGKSPFADKLALQISPEKTPLGICTSSGTIGPSLSFGKADAVVILSPDASLADAAATAVGNQVKSRKDVEKAVKLASKLPNILGALVIKDDQLAAWGDIEIVPWKTEIKNG